MTPTTVRVSPAERPADIGKADIAASVTGHLGPHAPPKLDGLVFVGIALRATKNQAKPAVKIHELRCRPIDARVIRQRWVVEQVLDLLANGLKTASRKNNG